MIVVDDGSTDGTPDVAQGFPEVRYLRQPNQLAATARNTGLEAARGEYVSFLDADDLMVEGRLRMQVDYLLTHPEASAVLGREKLLIEDGVEPPNWVREIRSQRERVLREEVARRTGTKLPTDIECYPPMSLTARREAFDQVGGFDPAFRLSEDADWLFRAWEEGLEIGFLDEIVIRRRIHGANASYDAAGCRAAMFQLFKARIDRQRARAAAGRSRSPRS